MLTLHTFCASETSKCEDTSSLGDEQLVVRPIPRKRKQAEIEPLECQEQLSDFDTEDGIFAFDEDEDVRFQLQVEYAQLFEPMRFFKPIVESLENGADADVVVSETPSLSDLFLE